MSARKLILLVFAILLAFTAVDIISWYASPASIIYKQSGNVVTLPGDSFQTTDELEPFQSVIYHLDKPLRGDSNIMFSYTQEDETSRLIQRKGLQNTTQVVFEIPLARYLFLDCYIDADVRITGVTVSDQPVGRAHAGYQPDFVRILVPSAVLVALVLLFVFVRPLNNLLKSVDQKIIDPETRYKGVTVAYIVLAVAALLHHIYVTMYHKYVLTGYTDLGVPLLIFSVITFLFGKLWKDKVSWILLALLCMKYARTALEGQQVLNNTTYIYYMSIYAFFGCYGVGRALSRKYWKPFFSAFCFGWALSAVVLAGFGIYAISTGIPIKNFGSEWFTVGWGNRAYFIYQSATAGIILSTSMAVTLLGCFLTKKTILKIVYILFALILFFAGSLTGTRAAYLLSALQLAMIICIALWDRLKPGQPKNAALTAGKYILLLIVFLVSVFAVAYIHYRSIILMDMIKTRSSLLVSTAFAESSEMPPLLQRDLGISAGWTVFFNGRIEIWSNTLKIITANTRNLLLGQSVSDPMALVNKFRISQSLDYIYHTHNTLLQIFLENGLPGLLLYLSFLFTFIFHAIRVFRNKMLPFWQRLLPVPAILCAAEGFIDNTCHVTYGYPQMTLLYLFAGFTIAISRQAKKDNSAI